MEFRSSRRLACPSERRIGVLNAISLAVPPTFWRQLRGDFERLQGHQFTLAWNTKLPLDSEGKTLASHWTWRNFPDESLKARLSAIAERGARALGHNSEDGWWGELRKAEFVEFELSIPSSQKRADGVMADWETGVIA